jgi:hypothetical protein
MTSNSALFTTTHRNCCVCNSSTLVTHGCNFCLKPCCKLCISLCAKCNIDFCKYCISMSYSNAYEQLCLDCNCN